ncbi:NrtA/SsuA/CpmA family ABC transporter substrate-binding protein [Aquabacter spiritensis]|uniref:NitT/TauT family transport system substrate-binding protein n=1 Tax=Aquabacter spiritensis TaxID=933073 RepID=A0A4R3M1M9_9HYPH|nr:NrtA/SsuA/CpmA family ABC transporter substrate-binding protein [Aquabacter spiritensis]TCT05015.1 NitT/TauT family transport system substrate-binding protein [Aquabacter spiritensis]
MILFGLSRRLLLAGLLALGATPPALAAETVRLAQNLSPISGVTIVAKAKGFFAKQGLDVQVSNFTSGKQCLDTVIGGGADIATTAEAPTTAAAMAQQPIAFLARTEYSDLKTLAATAAKIATLADLKGKRIAFTAGTGGEVYTNALLKKAGLSKSDVTLVNLRPQDMAAAMASGSIDAYNTWEPHIINGKRALGADVKQLDTAGIYSETFNIVTLRSYLAAKPKVIAAFLTALVEADAWMKANPAEAITLVAQAVNMPRAELEPIWGDFHYDVALDQKTLDILGAHAAWRLESGNHPPGATLPDWKSVIVAGPLRDVAPKLVTLPAGY